MLCLGVGLFRFILFGTLGFLDLDSCFLPQVRQVFCPFSLSSPGTSVMWTFLHDVVLWVPQVIFIFFHCYFEFDCPFFKFTDPSSASFNLLLIPFSIVLLYILQLFDFLIFSVCWSSHCVHPCSVSIFMTIILNSYQVSPLSSLRTFSEAFCCSFVSNISSISSLYRNNW